MDIQQEMGHFGMMKFCLTTGRAKMGEGEGQNRLLDRTPFVILLRTGLRFHDGGRDAEDKDDKTKAHVVFAYNVVDPDKGPDWNMVGWLPPHNWDLIDQETVERMVLGDPTVDNYPFLPQ